MKLNPDEILGNKKSGLRYASGTERYTGKKPKDFMEVNYEVAEEVPNAMLEELDPEYNSFATRTHLGQIALNTEIKNVIRMVKKYDPEVFKDCFGRIFRDVDRFEDWRVPYVYSAVGLVNATSDYSYLQNYQAARNQYYFTLKWFRCGKPHFFVEKEVYEAIRDTAPPVEFDFNDFKFPDDAVMFTLPKGSLKFREFEIAFVGVSKFDKGHHIQKYKNYLPTEADVNHERFLLVAGSRSGEWFFAPSFAWDTLKEVVSMQADDFMDAANDALRAQRAKSGKPTVEIQTRDDAKFIQDILIWTLNLILAMEALPEIVEKGVRVGTRAKRRDSVQEIWSPNVIGRRFRIAHEYDPDAPKGTHASPRMHRRRGHMRKQGIGHRYHDCTCGHEGKRHDAKHGYCLDPTCMCTHLVYKPVARFDDYKPIWIKPCWVSATKTKGE